jgi:hypothetical protein
VVTVNLAIVLYGPETWSLTLWDEHKLRVFESRMLRRIFGSKRDEVKGEWRRLHNEELYDLYSFIHSFIHSFRSLPYDRSVASSKDSSSQCKLVLPLSTSSIFSFS